MVVMPTGHSAHHPQDQQPLHTTGFDPQQDLREDAALQVSSSSSRRCQHQGLHSYSHGILSEDEGLLGRDGNHLTKWGKGIVSPGWPTW